MAAGQRLCTVDSGEADMAEPWRAEQLDLSPDWMVGGTLAWRAAQLQGVSMTRAQLLQSRGPPPTVARAAPVDDRASAGRLAAMMAAQQARQQSTDAERHRRLAAEAEEAAAIARLSSTEAALVETRASIDTLTGSSRGAGARAPSRVERLTVSQFQQASPAELRQGNYFADVAQQLFSEASPVFHSGNWVDGATNCASCSVQFGTFSCRRHHCRRCGQAVCGLCSGSQVQVLPEPVVYQTELVATTLVGLEMIRSPQRVCDRCHVQLLFILDQDGSPDQNQLLSIMDQNHAADSWRAEMKQDRLMGCLANEYKKAGQEPAFRLQLARKRLAFGFYSIQLDLDDDVTVAVIEQVNVTRMPGQPLQPPFCAAGSQVTNSWRMQRVDGVLSSAWINVNADGGLNGIVWHPVNAKQFAGCHQALRCGSATLLSGSYDPDTGMLSYSSAFKVAGDLAWTGPAIDPRFHSDDEWDVLRTDTPPPPNRFDARADPCSTHAESAVLLQGQTEMRLDAQGTFCLTVTPTHRAVHNAVTEDQPGIKPPFVIVCEEGGSYNNGVLVWRLAGRFIVNADGKLAGNIYHCRPGGPNTDPMTSGLLTEDPEPCFGQKHDGRTILQGTYDHATGQLSCIGTGIRLSNNGIGRQGVRETWHQTNEGTLDLQHPAPLVLSMVQTDAFAARSSALWEWRFNQVQVLPGFLERALDINDVIAEANGGCGPAVVLTPAPQEQMTDIGTFAAHRASPGRDFLAASGRNHRPCPPATEIKRLLASQPHASPTASFISLQGVLSLTACRKLVAHLDQHTAASTTDDLKVTLTEAELANLVGRLVVDGLKKMMPAGMAQDFTTIKLRRCTAVGQCINFHTDVSHRTMQVALTDENTYGGGALVFANAEGLHFPLRPAGSATIHDKTVVHGVTELVHGVRYGLFFLVEHD